MFVKNYILFIIFLLKIPRQETFQTSTGFEMAEKKIFFNRICFKYLHYLGDIISNAYLNTLKCILTIAFTNFSAIFIVN